MRAGRAIEVTVEPFDRVCAARRRALDEQAQRLGRLLEGEPRLTVGPVTAGAHA